MMYRDKRICEAVATHNLIPRFQLFWLPHPVCHQVVYGLE